MFIRKIFYKLVSYFKKDNMITNSKLNIIKRKLNSIIGELENKIEETDDLTLRKSYKSYLMTLKSTIYFHDDVVETQNLVREQNNRNKLKRFGEQ